MRRLREYLAHTYLDFDVRSLGVFRVIYASVLLVDLCLRMQVLSSFYSNAGLFPNHTFLWAPAGPRVISLFFSASSRAEALVLMLISAGCFVSLLVGYRTRLAQVASWIMLYSLDARLALLANGGDDVLNLLGLWTLFLPLGERFSVDAWLASRPQPRAAFWRAQLAGPARQVRSLACLALILQFTAIYAFNAAQKNGPTWLDGSAVHYTLHQDRIIKPLGVLFREQAPAALLAGLTHATIWIEAVGALAIASPIFPFWTRTFALLVMPGLHVSFELFLDLGCFSFAMMAFFPLLLSSRHWLQLERLIERRRGAWTGAPAPEPAPAATRSLQHLRRGRSLLREAWLGLLIVACVLEAPYANPIVPVRYQLPRSEWWVALVQYTRAFQGWRMFAPHAPLEDYMIEVDAETIDGRHVDPYNLIASRVHGPGLTEIPSHLHQNQFFTAYSLFIWMPQYQAYLQAFREWILRYHERTGRPQDQIVRFVVYKLTDNSPAPGQIANSNFRREVFLRHPE